MCLVGHSGTAAHIYIAAVVAAFLQLADLSVDG
jgi:hypothetical protein